MSDGWEKSERIKCSKCKKPIEDGQEMTIAPNKKVYCTPCANTILGNPFVENNEGEEWKK